MGFQQGNSKLIGNDGKYQYYKSGDQYMVRSLYKTPKGIVNTAENYANTRLAGLEFAACSSLAADWYKQAKLYLPYLHKWYAMAKFTAALRKVVNGSEAEAGSRELCMSKHKNLALGMELNSGRNFVDVFKMPFVCRMDAAAQQLVTEVSPFTPAGLGLNDTGATLLRLFCFAVVVPDGELDATAKRFVFKTDFKAIKTRFCFGEYIPLIQNKNMSASLKIDLNGVFVSGDKAHGWVFVGAELCRRNNKGIELLYNSSVCKLVDSFVCGL